MNTLTHATSRVLPNKRSNLYTPGLHGRPSTILIGALKVTDLSFTVSIGALKVRGPSFTDSVAGTCILLVLVGDCLLAFPPIHSCDASCSLVKGGIDTFGNNDLHSLHPCILPGCP